MYYYKVGRKRWSHHCPHQETTWSANEIVYVFINGVDIVLHILLWFYYAYLFVFMRDTFLRWLWLVNFINKVTFEILGFCSIMGKGSVRGYDAILLSNFNSFLTFWSLKVRPVHYFKMLGTNYLVLQCHIWEEQKREGFIFCLLGALAKQRFCYKIWCSDSSVNEL